MRTQVTGVDWRADPDVKAGTAVWLVLLSCAMIGLGGVGLGLQIDGNSSLVGTGYTSLGLGALVALVVVLVQAGSARRMPREPLAILSAVAGFFGLASIVSGVLAPGGSWMFFELLLLFWLLSRRKGRGQAFGPELRGGDLWLLLLMLIFRLWITYKGSEYEWELISIDVPVLAWIPAPWLAPIQEISLGSFTPQSMGFPPTGLDFSGTLVLWALGFALTASGLYLRSMAGAEHENDRIHALIHTLPPAVAVLVERALPEEEWEQLGLHGLSERRLAKRIEALVGERVHRQRQFDAAWRASALPQLNIEPGFAGDIHSALVRYGAPELPEGPLSEDAAK